MPINYRPREIYVDFKFLKGLGHNIPQLPSGRYNFGPGPSYIYKDGLIGDISIKIPVTAVAPITYVYPPDIYTINPPTHDIGDLTTSLPVTAWGDANLSGGPQESENMPTQAVGDLTVALPVSAAAPSTDVAAPDPYTIDPPTQAVGDLTTALPTTATVDTLAE